MRRLRPFHIPWKPEPTILKRNHSTNPPIMNSSRLFHWTASLVLASLCLGGSVEAASKKLLVVTVTKGFRHSSIPTAESVLGALARGSSHFEVDYARTDEEIAEKMNPQALQQWDGLC